MFYTNFNEWISDVCDFYQKQISDIVYGVTEYTFTIGNEPVAYWDRNNHAGYVALEDSN